MLVMCAPVPAWSKKNGEEASTSLSNSKLPNAALVVPGATLKSQLQFLSAMAFVYRASVLSPLTPGMIMKASSAAAAAVGTTSVAASAKRVARRVRTGDTTAPSGRMTGPLWTPPVGFRYDASRSARVVRAPTGGTGRVPADRPQRGPEAGRRGRAGGRPRLR